MLEHMKEWMLAFYSPCQVKILPNVYDDTLKEKKIDSHRNKYNQPQYDAVDIINRIIEPKKKSLPDAIGVISFTDVDLFTEYSNIFCFAKSIYSKGTVQSIYRLINQTEKYYNEEIYQSKQLLRILKISSKEIGHLFGLTNCIYYNCLMMGANGRHQIDQNPLYLCPVCYRKLFKCLKFNNVQRYERLALLCKSFGGAFMGKNEAEPNDDSYGTWFEKRFQAIKLIEHNIAIGLHSTERNIIKPHPPFTSSMCNKRNTIGTAGLFGNIIIDKTISRSPFPKKRNKSASFIKNNITNVNARKFILKTGANNRNSRSPNLKFDNNNNLRSLHSDFEKDKYFFPKSPIQSINLYTTINNNTKNTRSDVPNRESSNIFLCKSKVANVFTQEGVYKNTL